MAVKNMSLVIVISALLNTGPSAFAGPLSISDTFSGSTLDSSKWVASTYKAGIGGVGAGSAVSTLEQTSGYVEGRVVVPTSGNTFGGSSSLRSAYNYNDGTPWIINFEWQALDDSPTPRHSNYHMIQITDGVYNESIVPLFASGDWTPVFSTGEEGSPFPDVANVLPDGTHNLYLTNDETLASPENWSIFIDSTSAMATLYDMPDLAGSVIGTTTLDMSDAWYLRWTASGGTSAGFPSKDISFRVFDFEANAVPEPASFILFGMGAVGFMGYGWRQRKRSSLNETS